MFDKNRPMGEVEKYNCLVAGCTNIVTFPKSNYEKYRKLGFVDKDGNVTKPKYCREHKEQKRKEREARQNQ